MRRFWLGWLLLLLMAEPSFAYTANKVWLSRINSGVLRVTVEYTVPALKERRQSYVDFTNETEAQKFYSDMVRGADFYYDNPSKRSFENPPPQPQPW